MECQAKCTELQPSTRTKKLCKLLQLRIQPLLLHWGRPQTRSTWTSLKIVACRMLKKVHSADQAFGCKVRGTSLLHNSSSSKTITTRRVEDSFCNGPRTLRLIGCKGRVDRWTKGPGAGMKWNTQGSTEVQV